MFYSYDFGLDFKAYGKRGKDNNFPILDDCPQCYSKKRLHRHGFYWRYGITDILIERVPICRLLCTVCGKTLSILPSFFIPYFQHTLGTVLNLIETGLKKRPIKCYRQLGSLYIKRFMSQLNWIHTFFMDRKRGNEVQRGLENKKATEYVIMIRDFGESTFFRRSKGHLSAYFMAPSL